MQGLYRRQAHLVRNVRETHLVELYELFPFILSNIASRLEPPNFDPVSGEDLDLSRNPVGHSEFDPKTPTRRCRAFGDPSVVNGKVVRARARARGTQRRGT